MGRLHANPPQLVFLTLSFFGGGVYSLAFVGKAITQLGGLVWLALSIGLLFLYRYGSPGERTAFTVPILLLQGIILYCWSRFPRLEMSFFWLSEPVVVSADVAVPLHLIFLLLGLLCLTVWRGPRRQIKQE